MKSVFVLLSTLISISVRGHPNNVICQDPRFRDGGRMMFTYVTHNPYTADIAFTVDAAQYEYNQAVNISIVAEEDSKFIGNFLAVQVEFTGADGGAQGYFHDLSDDLDYTPGCSTSAFSKTAGGSFAGKSYLSWTPHDDGTLRTRGNATFKLVFGNGVGGMDPLADAMKIVDPHLYMKTVTLWDPERWNPNDPVEPVQPGSDSKCVMNASSSSSVKGHTYKKSPVFVQHLDEGSQTFATDKCLRCRQGEVCKSAKVICPGRPGEPMVERTWLASTTCEGEPTGEVALPEGFAVCPGPDHHSPMSVDLERFVPKLQRDFPDWFASDAEVRVAIEEYRKMLVLVQKFPGEAVVPSKLVDLVWHAHILDTEAYKRDSLRMFGHYLHHAPSFGGNEEKQELVELQRGMFERYDAVFEENPAPEIWGPNYGVAEWPAEKTPDCCSADCVKPDCAGCVGCNAVDCGFFATEDELAAGADSKSRRQYLDPQQFAGYVATRSPQPLPAASDDIWSDFLCTVEPMKDMKLGWSIAAEKDYIYFQHQFTRAAWYGFGLNNISKMDLGDFMVSMYNEEGLNNFTGVKDMYKYDSASGYPCWDVLHQCSADHNTAGTKDTEDDVITRVDGNTVTTWNRRLVPDDFKDRPITADNVTVLFAHGESDDFQYHGDNQAACTVNFYSGFVQCN